MKITVEIADELLAEASTVAMREKTTLGTLIEDGLREALGKRRSRRAPFKVRMVTFRGDGLHPAIGEGGWERLRDLS